MMSSESMLPNFPDASSASNAASNFSSIPTDFGLAVGQSLCCACTATTDNSTKNIAFLIIVFMCRPIYAATWCWVAIGLDRELGWVYLLYANLRVCQKKRRGR